MDRKEENNREYTNGEITVFWQPKKCVHATYCYKDLVDVFNPRKRPWVNMAGAPTDQIIKVINKCPTEALTYKWNDEKRNKEEANLKNEKIQQALSFSEKQELKPVTIQVMRDGPLVVQGLFKVYDGKGNLLHNMSITSFCRCGATNNAPYCDGMHRKTDFKAD